MEVKYGEKIIVIKELSFLLACELAVSGLLTQQLIASRKSCLKFNFRKLEFGYYKHRLEHEQMGHGTTNAPLRIR
jgi:hypothetical protein